MSLQPFVALSRSLTRRIHRMRTAHAGVLINFVGAESSYVASLGAECNLRTRAFVNRQQVPCLSVRGPSFVPFSMRFQDIKYIEIKTSDGDAVLSTYTRQNDGYFTATKPPQPMKVT